MPCGDIRLVPGRVAQVDAGTVQRVVDDVALAVLGELNFSDPAGAAVALLPDRRWRPLAGLYSQKAGLNVIVCH
jgi:hypothetical protein